MGVRSEPHKSNLGNLFYVNDVSNIYIVLIHGLNLWDQQDFSNPEVAPHIQKYPEDVNGGSISEIWQVELGRWHNIPLDELTPSILIGYKRYYIHEVAELSDGHWVIPALWIVCQGKTYADCHLVEMSRELQVVQSVKPEIVRISLDKFSYTHEDLVERLGAPIAFTNTFHNYSAQIPNKFRTIDNGEDLFPVWADDVSGARSKQYQKHINVYTANANLPGQLLQQEYFVRFVSTSPHAGALEQLKVVRRKLLTSVIKEIISVRDARLAGPVTRKNVRMGIIPSMSISTLLQAGQPRSVEEIRSCILTQLSLATYGVAARVKELQTATGTKDEIAQHWIDILIQKSREMQATNPGRLVDDISTELLIWSSKETDQPYNPLLDLSYFDPSQDTLVEILHTILLGNAKYTWYELHHNWTPVQQNIFTIRLQSTNLDGLHVPPIRAAYMMQS
ncbi:hypothetical protein B0H10DRAFT_1949032 [Mycena sp. CBHHK59/15]|nr:hypothetical protein B0H10DRAFT_1949032 [Mycena sp. CBHHK59/15]